MAGEQHKDDLTREEYPWHFAAADAVGGSVKPFDVYQGPYVYTDGDGYRSQRIFLEAPSSLGRWWNEQTEQYSDWFPLWGDHSARYAAAAIHQVAVMR